MDAGNMHSSNSEAANEGQVGVEPAFEFAVPAAADDVAAFVQGRADTRRIESLLRGFLLLDWWGDSPSVARPTGELLDFPPTPAWAITAPFFARRPRGGQSPILRVGHTWPQLLISGRVDDVVADALRRLRIAGVDVALSNTGAIASEVDGLRLAASLLVPISSGARSALLERIAPSDPLEREVSGAHQEEVAQ